MLSSIDHLSNQIHTISYTDLSNAWGVGVKSVRSRLNGERDLTVREISAAAKLLGISTSDLLG